MRVTIENVKEIEKGWLRSKPMHKLYVTLELSEEEIFVLENRYHLQGFTLVEGVDDVPHKPTIRASILLDTSFRSKILGTANRLCVFSHPEMNWVNYCEDNLHEGLKKWKDAISAGASNLEKRPEKKTLEL
jgi:hypothetical protein